MQIVFIAEWLLKDIHLDVFNFMKGTVPNHVLVHTNWSFISQHRAKWGSSVTHLQSVATFSKCLCLAKGERFTWFYFLPWNFLRQFDTHEKCNQGGTSVLQAALHSFLELAPGHSPHLGPPGLLPEWAGLPVFTLTSGNTLDTVWTVCLGIVSHPWRPAVPGQGLPWGPGSNAGPRAPK